MQSRDHRNGLRYVAIALLVCALSSPAHADPAWYSGRDGRNRLLHLGITATFGLVFLSGTVLSSTIAPASCRWCEPPAFDRSTRDAVVWNNVGRANLLSNLDAYVLAPALGFGLLIAVDHDAGWARLLDDTIPVAETIAIGQTITQVIKLSVGRQRPATHFGDPNQAPTTDDNTSFISGHSELGFSITASAGLICHWRHYWTEPYVWGTGVALSLSTEYLRMGADKHYLSDVVAGGIAGIGAGLLIPRLMRQDVSIVPISNGVAIAGVF